MSDLDIPIYITRSPIMVTGLYTIRTWEMLLTMPGPIRFPEPEGHWHFKFRMFKQWLRRLPNRLRWKIFPYHIVHKDAYQELLEYE